MCFKSTEDMFCDFLGSAALWLCILLLAPQLIGLGI